MRGSKRMRGSRKMKKRRLRKKQQKGGHVPSNSNDDGGIFYGKGQVTNTLTNINNAGGQILTDSALAAENGLYNFFNNLTGKPEIMSPDVTKQHIG